MITSHRVHGMVVMDHATGDLYNIVLKTMEYVVFSTNMNLYKEKLMTVR